MMLRELGTCDGVDVMWNDKRDADIDETTIRWFEWVAEGLTDGRSDERLPAGGRRAVPKNGRNVGFKLDGSVSCGFF